MTIDDALKAMAVIDNQNDGSEARTVLAEALQKKLLQDPANFWEFFFEMLDASQPNSYRELAERLLRGGVVNEQTTIGDIPAILAWDAAASPEEMR